MAVAADPAAVNARVAQYPSADGFDVALAQIATIDIGQGVAVLAMPCRVPFAWHPAMIGRPGVFPS